MEEAIILESKEQVVAKAAELAQGDTIPTKSDMDQLKQQFYRFHNQAMQEARKKYIDDGGDPEAYVPEMDPDEETFRQSMQVLRIAYIGAHPATDYKSRGGRTAL